MQRNALYPRFIGSRLAEALEDYPVVLIQGPRQCGKTTLAQMVCAPDLLPVGAAPGSAAGGGYSYLSFDDDVVRAGAEADPMGFVAGLPERVVLDEVQRVPALFTALKLEVDRRRTPGRFVPHGFDKRARSPSRARLFGRPAGDRPAVSLVPRGD